MDVAAVRCPTTYFPISLFLNELIYSRSNHPYANNDGPPTIFISMSNADGNIMEEQKWEHVRPPGLHSVPRIQSDLSPFYWKSYATSLSLVN